MARGRDYYQILGVPRDASDAQLKKAYKKLAVKWHPDKHKTGKEKAEAKFKDVGEAFAVLSDPEKRKVFDMYGEEGLKAGVQPGSGGGHNGGYSGFENIDPNEIFAEFFKGASFGLGGSSGKSFTFSSGGGGNHGFSSGIPMNFGSQFGNTQDPMDVDSGYPYQNMHAGRKRKLEKPKACSKDLMCTLEENFQGVTKKLRIRRKEVDRNGRLSEGSKILEVHIKPGMKEGTKFTFHGEGDQSPTQETQDVVFTLKNKPHQKFTRNGDDLHHTVNLSLEQAVKGARITVPTLEGKEVNILSEPLRESKQQMTLIGQGMINSKTGARGNLILSFNIKLPHNI